MTNQIEILLFDKNKQNYLTTKQQLNSIKGIRFNLYWTNEYDKAKKLLFEQQYDVYLLDYETNESTGLNLLEEVFGEPKFHKPVIILTDEEVDQLDLKALQTGASDYLVKNQLTAAILQKAIHYAIKRYNVMAELFRKEQLNISLFDQSVEPHFLLNKNLTIYDVNPEFCKVYGLKREQVIGESMLSFITSNDDKAQFEGAISKSGRIKNFETDIKFKSKKVRHCNMSCSKIKTIDGRVDGYQGLMNDLTDKRKTEHEKHLSEKYLMTERLSRMIAHEVRNPLTNINLATSQLINNVKPKQQNYIDIIKRNAGRINELITQLLKASIPTELVKRTTDIHDVLEDAILLISDRASLNNITISRKYDERAPKLSVDSQRLCIAITNILVNGIEAIGTNKGQLTISTKYLSTSKRLKIVIKDNGGGMDEDTSKSLFEPFFTKKKSGTGLGLSTVRNIIIAHEGEIYVESQLKKGTKIIIKLKQDA